MPNFENFLILFIVLLNFRLLSTSRIMACIQSLALQAFLCGVLAYSMNPHKSWLVIIFLCISTASKGILIPWLLRRTAIKVGVKRELEPLVGYSGSLLSGTLLLGICLLIGAKLKTGLFTGISDFFIPGTFFTILTGLFLIVARKKAITQVLGYLTLENGIYNFGFSFPISEPLIMEMGILLDVFTAIFIMGITIYHINREFDHIDTDRFSLPGGEKK